MSNHTIKEHFMLDDVGWELLERTGRVEMWFARQNLTYQIILYENILQDEEPLLCNLVTNTNEANELFDKVVKLCRTF